MEQNLTIKNQNGVMTIDSREVAEMLEKEHKEVIRDIEGGKKAVGIIPTLVSGNFPPTDYFIESTYLDSQNKPRKCYLITKMGCELLGNKQQGAKGILFSAKYVKRFNEMENQLKLQIPKDSYMIEDPIARAKRWIEEQEEKKQLEEENKKLLPKAKFADSIEISLNSIGFKEFADLLHIPKFGRNTMMKWFRKQEYINSNNEPYRRYIEQGLFETKESTFVTPYGKTLTNITTYITGKGQIYFQKKIDEYLKEN